VDVYFSAGLFDVDEGVGLATGFRREAFEGPRSFAQNARSG